MTESTQHGSPDRRRPPHTTQPSEPSEPSEPTQRPRGVTRNGAVGVAAGVLAGALLATGAVVLGPAIGGPSCADTERPALTVVTTPELVDVVRDVAAEVGSGGERCALAVTVTARPPGTTAADLDAERGERPDVWIPDSSVWTRRPTRPGSGVPGDNPSVAASPVVLAMTPAVAARHGADRARLADLIPADDERPTLRWVLPEPEGSAATVAALIELQQAVHGSPGAAARYGTVVRTAVTDVVTLADLPARGEVAVPATEQQVYAYNQANPGRRLVGAHAAAGFRFDYPFVVLTAERARRDRAAQILAGLQGDAGQRRLATAGFRSPAGAVGTDLAGALGPTAGRTGVGPLSDAGQVGSAIRGYTSLLRPTRLLAVLDVSGSMAAPVPGAAGTTRLDLAVRASVTGLAVYPDDTVLGVWAFSTRLSGDRDHKVMAPLQELGRGADGSTGRQRVAEALGRIRVTKGRTGLNDTVLAAVREVRGSWDPKRVNSVVVITDGGNSDPDGISTRALLRTLRAERDPERPVAVFAIAYGPESDFAGLQQISAATGGRAYAAPDPRAIGQVLADAIGRRSCAPAC